MLSEPPGRLHADRADRRRPQQAPLPLPGRQGARHDRRAARDPQGAAARRGAHRDALGRRPQARRRGRHLPRGRACRSRRCRTSATSSTATTISSPSCARCRSRTSSAASPVALDPVAVGAYVRGRVVLVTGAGGSIGSELCRQLVRMDVGRLVLVDHAENNLFQIERAAARDARGSTLVPDDRRRARRRAHGARSSRCTSRPSSSTPPRYKHVPLMEQQPVRGAAQQRARHAHRRAPRGAPRRRALRAHLDRQGRQPDRP